MGSEETNRLEEHLKEILDPMKKDLEVLKFGLLGNEEIGQEGLVLRVKNLEKEQRQLLNVIEANTKSDTQFRNEFEMFKQETYIKENQHKDFTKEYADKKNKATMTTVSIIGVCTTLVAAAISKLL